MIEVRQLTKRFGATVAVHQVSFSVKRGEVLGFLGPNGAGKTTTMRILTGYMPADEGTASIAGFDIFTDSIEARKRIGYLPESAPLYNEMGVLDFLRYIGELRQVPRAELPGRVGRMVETCGLGRVRGKDIGELSKGYRQRVGLAQAMIHDPDVLLLDEPTSGLDPNQIIEIRELIKHLGREKTVILSTHILPEVTATCSRVLIINEGSLVADDTPERLAARARSGQLVLVTLKGTGPELRESLDGLPGLLAYRELERPGPDRVRIQLEAGPDGDLAEQVYRLAVARGWVITELRPEAATLEDVFLQLTGEGRAA